MKQGVRPTASLLLFLAVFLLVTPLAGIVQVASAPPSSFQFASAGDMDSPSSGDGLSSLNRLRTSGASFFLGVGDYSYNSSVTGNAWCSSFKTSFPNIEIVAGNHDTGEGNITDTTSTRSYEKYVAGCPFTLGSQPPMYGKEFYFDYPSTSPLARFIMISPKVYNVTGSCQGQACTSSTRSCTDAFGCWPYSQNDAHYNWTARTIDDARTAQIRWIIVGMHKPCLSVGTENCSIGAALFNMLVSKKVDLILQGHDHSYERSKQFGFSGTCGGFTTTNGFVNYNSNCIVDDGSRIDSAGKSFYSPGAGTVVVIEGTFGAGFGVVNDPSKNGGANAAEAPYFAKLMGLNTPGAGHGFLKYTVSADRIDVSTDFAGSFSDAWSISGPPLPLGTSFSHSRSVIPVNSPEKFNATASGGIQPYSFDWSFGDGGSGTGVTVSHTYSGVGNYNVTLTAGDLTGMVAKSSQTVTVRIVTTYSFSPTGDTYVQQDTPTTNYGSALSFIVDSSPVKDILLKFNVSVPGPVVGATLRLYQVDSSDKGGDFHTAPANWAEKTVTWNNAPVVNPTIFFSLGRVVLNTWYNVSMNSVVTGSGVVSLRVTSSSPTGDGSYFASKERGGGLGPQLLVYVSSGPPNTAPRITVPTGQTVDEQTPLTFNVTATDDPAQTITLSAVSIPSGANFPSVSGSGSVTGTFTWTPSEAQGPGTYTPTFQAIDNLGASSQTSVNTTVSEVNRQPSISVPGPQTVSVGSILTFTVTATDPDIPPNALTLSASSLVSGMNFDSSTGSLSFTPTADQSDNTFTVSFTATDNGSPSYSDTRTVTINVTSGPIITIPGDQTVDEKTLLTFTVSATDKPDRTVTLTCDNCASLGATFLSVPGTASTSGTVSWVPSEAQGPGKYTIRFTATNDLGASGTGNIIVNVNEVNSAPTLDPILSQSVDELTPVGFTATASDPDLPANTLTFSLDTGAPSGASITATGTFSWTPSEAQGPGIYSITVRVTDNGWPSMSDSKSFTINVREVNQAPTVTPSVSSPQTVVYGTTLTFNVTANDTDIPANSITLSASGLVSGMSFTGGTGNPASGAFSFTPSTSQVGNAYNVTFTATDNAIPSASSGAIVTIRVVPRSIYALVVSSEGKVFRYQNNTFTQIGQPVTTPLRQVAWKPDGSYALIAGDFAVLLKYDGNQFTPITTGISTGLNFWTVSWKPDGQYALIGGTSGLLLKYDGSSVTRITNSFTQTILSLSWHPSGNYTLMVGRAGLMLTYDGTTIRPVSTSTTGDLNAVAWNPNGQYALAGGVNGVILRYDGSSARALNTTGVYSPTRVVRFIAFDLTGSIGLIVGDTGLVLSYDGNALSLIQGGLTNTLYSIGWSGQTAYIVGGTGAIESYAGGVLKKLPSNTTSSLRGIAWKPA